MRKLIGILSLLCLMGTSCSVSTPISKSTSSIWEITSNPYPEYRFYQQPEHGVYTMTWYEDNVLHIRYFRY